MGELRYIDVGGVCCNVTKDHWLCRVETSISWGLAMLGSGLGVSGLVAGT